MDGFQVVTLGDVLDLADCQIVDLLKMDIEGAEHDVFVSASPELLRRFKRIAVEYHDNLRPGTLALLQERLSATHEIVDVEGSDEGYGILRARLRGESGVH